MYAMIRVGALELILRDSYTVINFICETQISMMILCQHFVFISSFYIHTMAYNENYLWFCVEEILHKVCASSPSAKQPPHQRKDVHNGEWNIHIFHSSELSAKIVTTKMERIKGIIEKWIHYSCLSIMVVIRSSIQLSSIRGWNPDGASSPQMRVCFPKMRKIS